MGQVASGVTPDEAARMLWRSVDGFGEEGSRQKEQGIARAIM